MSKPIPTEAPTILMARQPIRFEARNYRGRHKRLKSGNIWIAELEIEREMWDLLDTVPAGAIFELVGWWSDGDPAGDEQPEPKLKAVKDSKPRGEHGAYWTSLFKRGFDNNLDLREVLYNLELLPDGSGNVKDALHEAFAVTSLTFVSPQQFERWCEDNKLEGLVTMSRLTQAELREATR